ncbi:hypothetical protein RCL1_004759 [Eukaryota sp. TZLM3-RCL]
MTQSLNLDGSVCKLKFFLNQVCSHCTRFVMLYGFEPCTTVVHDGLKLTTFPNEIVTLCLDVSHPAVSSFIQSVTFLRNLGSSAIKVSPDTKIASITTTTTTYTITAGLSGELIEMNNDLVENPALLKSPNTTFIAVFKNIKQKS